MLGPRAATDAPRRSARGCSTSATCWGHRARLRGHRARLWGHKTCSARRRSTSAICARACPSTTRCASNAGARGARSMAPQARSMAPQACSMASQARAFFGARECIPTAWCSSFCGPHEGMCTTRRGTPIVPHLAEVEPLECIDRLEQQGPAEGARIVPRVLKARASKAAE